MWFAEKIVPEKIVLPEGSPNGVKVCDGTLYCTTSNIVSPISCVYRIGNLTAAPMANNSEPPIVHRCYRRFAFFDDFDCVRNGFVVAAPSDLARLSDVVPQRHPKILQKILAARLRYDTDAPGGVIRDLIDRLSGRWGKIKTLKISLANNCGRNCHQGEGT